MNPREDHPALPGVRSTLIGIAINVALALVKFASGVIGHSYALIADAIESLSDVVTSAVLLIGLRYAMRPPDEDHPYGHGKAEPLAATVVSLALFGAAVIIAIESIHEILTPHSTPHAFTLVVLALVVLIKEGLYRYVFDVSEVAQSTALKSDAWHHRADALTSAVAFLGISIALIGGPGWQAADDWAALAASAVIMFNAYLLLRPAVLELTDSSAPDARLRLQVREIAQGVPGVEALDKCYVRKMGFDFYVDLHVVVAREMPVWQGHEIAHLVKDALRAAQPRIADVLVHIEPTSAIVDRMLLEVNRRLNGGVTVLDLTGQVRAGAGADSLRNHMMEAFQHSSRYLLLNGENLSYADSASLGEMVYAYASIVRGGGIVKLLRPHPRLRQLLTLTNLDRVFEVFEDERAAVASFNSGNAARSQQAIDAFLRDG
ncbi:MAG: cation diffusion facilitator family transporter [Bryobacteraceae bacterium]|nr:cation diffusion facilitator family transporter [Bryobacteraceae bacterium]